ncbi:phosphoglycerate kinase [Dinoroseobacter shibae DFL 12 = DSM 16493]|uniref:Phosphoglycerate kinase n=1 Tax=Dinoroseobacter shibae (strain DSM 16493 / NCIMB 14021 / DFL 12) TaxID=398580 RepID=PGK_DINSH|nr:phosphoglycerate kinase [Dinoroseobacter shibae]A8LQM4.1 RecName: Full=Phosphoglycerate kinase [Dinoroseobacter shibae DFL 12 = DSM 16493]ABV93891.1 phosphoglycerate kinase [Dinoroseobacter shibae DFL 12 = DSM 16493]URF45340.1 phosphoglycerate kinase [Dinoroseobacter shibae]URF49645.1 phosphoglycerate kinase [Dinoroseobacter shibae]
MTWKTLDDMALDGKIVLTRVDINVPVADGVVTDTTRIERIVPTVTDILAKGGLPVLLAHFGRPKGKVVPEMSLRVVLPALEEALGRPVEFIAHPDRAALEALPKCTVVLAENTRFAPGEEKNDPEMAAALAALGDIYCNDAFSAAHRAHASTEGIARLLPSCAGRLMQAELEALQRALGTPTRPVVAVVGGAKVSTKLALLGNLVEKVDDLVIGGGMANTFLAAQGIDVGASLAEHEMADTAREIMEKAARAGCSIHLPKDIVVARKFEAGAPSQTLPVSECPRDAMILDAGPETVAALKEVFAQARTLIWNGPLGAFEIPPFDMATNAAARAAADATKAGTLITVAGGGDTVAALNKAGVADDFTYISTAGGAFLEWMEGKTLPGVAALEAA